MMNLLGDIAKPVHPDLLCGGTFGVHADCSDDTVPTHTACGQYSSFGGGDVTDVAAIRTEEIKRARDEMVHTSILDFRDDFPLCPLEYRLAIVEVRQKYGRDILDTRTDHLRGNEEVIGNHEAGGRFMLEYGDIELGVDNSLEGVRLQTRITGKRTSVYSTDTTSSLDQGAEGILG